MGMEDIYNLLEKKPRLTKREIAEILGQEYSKVNKLINKMVKRKKNPELRRCELTEEEIKRVNKNFPNLIKYAHIVYVYEVI